MNETKEKKPRAKRRNYERELSMLKQYCEIKRDVLVSLDVLNSTGEASRLEVVNGQIEAYGDVLRRMG